MANIRKNRQTRHKGDVQSLITSAILTQKGEFTRKDIFVKVHENLKYSPYGKYGKLRETINLGDMINNTINTLWVIDAIKSEGEKYVLHINFPALK